MIQKIARSILTILMIGSLGISIFNFHTLWLNPTATLFVERALDNITARIEKQISTQVSQESIESQLSELLEEATRNWLVIEAIEQIAVDRGVIIGLDLQDKRDTAYDEDHGFLIALKSCGACAANPAACKLTPELFCRAPIDLTPVGDVVGLIRESKNYIRGEDVDMFELGLSVVGLGAVVLVPLTGGTSATVKVGASMAKVAKRMDRISDPLLDIMIKTFRESIDWDIIAKSNFGNYSADIRRAIQPDAIRPAMMIIDDLGSIQKSVGVTDTLHLMKSIESPTDARAIARVAEVTKERTVGVIEVLGKNRVFRSTMRYSDEIIAGIVGVFGMFVALLGLLGSFLGSLSIRTLRNITKPRKEILE